MKKKVALIGLGTIAQNYYTGLTTSPIFELVAVCDKNNNAISKEMYKAYPFFLDYTKILQYHNLDYVIIATNPATHLPIADYFISKKINVLLEKPACLNFSDYRNVIEHARVMQVKIDTIFHWMYGSDII